VFPLYYHWDDPFGATGGTDTLFPLWIFNSDTHSHYSLHLAWPFCQFKTDEHASGFRVWPVFADWRLKNDGYYGWYAWPLGWRWGDDSTRNRMLMPLFYQRTTPDDTTFASLLAGWHKTPDSGWSYLVPAGYRHNDPDGTRGWYTLLGGNRRDLDGDGFWYAVPALAWGNREGTRTDTWIGGPLYHHRASPEASSSHLLPLYYYSQDRDNSLFISLPYSHHRDGSETWNLVPPFWFNYRDDAGSFALTPLYMRGRDNRTGKDWSAIPPVYYHRDTERGDTFLSPLYGAWSGAGDSRHALVPPLLSYYRNGDDRGDIWTLGGLGHVSWGPNRGSSYLFPLYYESADDSATLSPLWARWKPTDDRTISLVPPLLSWSDRESDHTDLHLLLALAKLSWGEKPSESWIFPLYYRNPAKDDFLSLAYARWHTGELTSQAIPPLLSSYSYSDTERECRLLLGLYGRNWSTRKDVPSSSWLFPVYAQGETHFLTLPAGRWKSDGTAFTYFPTPLFGWRSGVTRGSWLFPLYFYSRDVASGQRNLYYLPWGHYESGQTRSESSLFPFYGYENTGPVEDPAGSGGLGRASGRSWHALYLAAYKNRGLPLSKWDPAAEASVQTGTTYQAYNRLFPLWRYERNLTTPGNHLEKEFALLFFLQDYWRKKDTVPEKEDYTRMRILWRFVHYERDHNTVSLDVFPSVTYDRDGKDKKKVSFLWRGFRYERKQDQKTVDLLFIPVWRTAWVAGTRDAQR
jgi:hypothetical protein